MLHNLLETQCQLKMLPQLPNNLHTQCLARQSITEPATRHLEKANGSATGSSDRGNDAVAQIVALKDSIHYLRCTGLIATIPDHPVSPRGLQNHLLQLAALFKLTGASHSKFSLTYGT